MRRGRELRRAVGFALLLVLVACSSTSKKAAEPLASSAADMEASANASGGAGGATASRGPGAAGGDTASGGGTSGGATGGSATGGASGAGVVGAKPLKAGPPIKIGMHYSEDLGTILTAAGAQDSTDGPAETVIDRLDRWVNTNGGFGGRKVEIVRHGTNPLGTSFSAQAQETCTHFTQDDKVSFVISGAAATPVDLVDCLSKAHIPMIWGLHVPIDAAMFKKYDGYLYQPFNMRNERQVAYIDMLFDAGWAPKGSKVGLLRVDTPLHDAYKREVIVPGLAKHGMKIASEVVFSEPRSSGDAGALYGQAANGVLRFRQAGVTHVLFVPTGGSIPFVWMSEAANQNYEPRYGLNTLDIPAFVDLNAPDGQLDGALAVGWLLTSDVLPPQRPTNPAERLCLKITDNRSDIPSRYCEGIFWLKAIFDAGASPTPASVRATVKTLGTSYVSPWTFKTDFRSGRPDGAAAIRLLRWGGTCECFEYVGPLKSVP